MKESPEDIHDKEIIEAARIYHAGQTYERIKARDPLPAYEAVLERIRKKRLHIWIRRIATAAACIAGVIVLSTALAYRKGVVQEVEPQIITVQSNPGMRANFTLPDGTIVYLNSGSTLRYPIPYNPKERQVSLSGEGFFNVAHNEKQPFVVKVLDNINVRVLGTEFNIQAYEGDNMIQTTLLAGSINLEVKKDGELRTIEMHPSDRAGYSTADEKIVVQKVNPFHDIAWIEGKQIFKDTPIPDVLKELSHFYNVKFDVEDKVIESYRFTGTFQNRQLSQILDYIKISSNIDFRINHTTEDDSNGVKHTIITLWKKK